MQTHHNHPRSLCPGPGPPVVPQPPLHARVPRSSVHGSAACGPDTMPPSALSRSLSLCVCLSSLSLMSSLLPLSSWPVPSPSDWLSLHSSPETPTATTDPPFRLCSLPSMGAPSLRLCLRSTNGISLLLSAAPSSLGASSPPRPRGFFPNQPHPHSAQVTPAPPPTNTHNLTLVSFVLFCLLFCFSLSGKPLPTLMSPRTWEEGTSECPGSQSLIPPPQRTCCGPSHAFCSLPTTAVPPKKRN